MLCKYLSKAIKKNLFLVPAIVRKLNFKRRCIYNNVNKYQVTRNKFKNICKTSLRKWQNLKRKSEDLKEMCSLAQKLILKVWTSSCWFGIQRVKKSSPSSTHKKKTEQTESQQLLAPQRTEAKGQMAALKTGEIGGYKESQLMRSRCPQLEPGLVGTLKQNWQFAGTSA